MPTIHLNITDWSDLFDKYDAAPLLQRSLNEDCLAYIFNRMDEAPRERHWTLHIHVPNDLLQQCSTEQLTYAIQQQLQIKSLHLKHSLRRHFRTARTALVIGLAILFTLLSLSVGLGYVVRHSDWLQALQESCVIIGWVAIWRPAELLLYDWWPLKNQERNLKRLLAGRLLFTTPD